MNPSDFDDAYSVSPKNMSDEQIARRDALSIGAIYQAGSCAAIAASLNALLGELCKSVERLQQERDALRAEVDRLNNLCSAISRDCNATALQRNEETGRANQLRAVLREMMSIEPTAYRNMDGTSVVHISKSLFERAEKLLAGG